MEEGQSCFIGKSDMSSAFRILGIMPSQYCLLVLKATSPFDGKTYFFIDKNLPFGGSISCSHFQRVSDSIAFLVRHRTNRKPVNYLDDYLFAAALRRSCNWQMRCFLSICGEINFPVALDKTFWGTQILVFLGLLIDTVNQVISIPADKIERAKNLIEEVLRSKKVTVHQLQRLSGFLNFLCRCIVPGRAFTRRLYTYFSSDMKPHYHVNVNRDMKEDLGVWKIFLNNPQIYCRPFIDYSEVLQASELDWYMDVSGKVGFGGHLTGFWFQGAWSEQFLALNPSIDYLELYAVTVSILLWGHKFKNMRIRLFCDNEGVCGMINQNSTRSKNCMRLIRIIVLKCLEYNLRVFAKWVQTDLNTLADPLSRYQMKRFWREVKRQKRTMDPMPHELPAEIWPPERIWIQ